MSLRNYSVQKRYTYRVLALMVAYAGALVLANWLFENVRPEGPAAWATALLPALPVIAVFFVIGRLLVELKDEYVRMLLVRQTLVASATMLTVATAYGFLEDFGLTPHLPAYYATVLWFAGLGVGGCLNAYLERGGAEA